MRVAAIYDIHGNVPALEAVLDEIDREGVDRILVGGDVVLGPMSSEALDLIAAIDTPVQCIAGNCEREVLAARSGTLAGDLPGGVAELIRWVADELSDEQARRLAEWPATLRLDIAGLGAVLFCHGTPRDDNEVFTRVTPDERLATAFGDLEAELVVCGHTHMQFDRHVGSVRVVNAGSVGMPFGEPGAYWLALGPDVELRRTGYDLDAAAERIRTMDYPQAEEFAARYVLDPPSEEAMLRAFEGGRDSG